MTTYTTIPDADIDQDSPVTQPLMTALRDNPIAIAEGAAGAPRIATAALKAPTAGTAHIIMRLQESANTTGSPTAYHPTQAHNRYDWAGHLGATCLVAGTITCYFQHSSGSGTAYARILKNGVQLAEWTAPGFPGTYIARQLDVSVAVGDSIVFQQYNPSANFAFWQLLRIYSNNPDMAVA